MHDLVIRGGTIVDGAGAEAFTGDIAVRDGVIAEVGGKAGPGRREIDAAGQIVCPGFIDTHTHLDGQATFDPLLAPSSWHGVTTVIMGNCGFGFAPVRPEDRRFLVEVMESVEEIPADVLYEGMPWDWESFPDYLDSLDRRPRAIDLAAQVPHCALRSYVMGQERAIHAQATAEEASRMGQLVRDAVRAGAVGFATSRTFVHRTKHGDLVPGTDAAPEELIAIARGMANGGSGVFQMLSDAMGREPDLQWMKEIARITGRPLVFSMVDVKPADDLAFRETLSELQAIYEAEGLDLRAAVPWRPPGFMMGLQTSLHPFSYYAPFDALRDKPLAEIVATMRRDDFRRAILSGNPDPSRSVAGLTTRWNRMYPLTEVPDYEPPHEASIAGLAEAAGVSPQEYAYDTLLRQDGRQFIFVPVANYTRGDFEILREMLTHPRTTASLSDAGAHVASVSDASFTTFMLTHWVKGRTRGPRLGLEEVVRMQTSEPAALYALHDRGVLAPGKKADINVIDVDGLKLHAPYMAFDLPNGGKRLLQKAEGLTCTLVNGEVIFERGELTDARPGKVVRSAGKACR
jgi:N-acyl-D-aspartate/D-glutamate deacylase